MSNRGHPGGQLLVFDQFSRTIAEHQIPQTHVEGAPYRPDITISSNGGYITIGDRGDISIFNREASQLESTHADITSPAAGELAMSADGRHIVYATPDEGLSIFAYDRGESIQDIPPITGWISDGQGHRWLA